MPDSTFDFIVIGGGIIGMATAMNLAKHSVHPRILVLEKEKQIGLHQTGHNSGVIHSGLYYKPGSAKAKTCVEGANAMIAFCEANDIPIKRCGKVVVARSENEVATLEMLYQRGLANGVSGLAMIGPERLREIEPHSTGIKAIHVPGTAITDYLAVTKKLAQTVIQLGGVVLTEAAVTNLRAQANEIIVTSTAGDFVGVHVINCAGLQSDRISRMNGIGDELMIAPFRGEYYQLVPAKEYLVKGLVYPVPDPSLPFLGVHFTRLVHGGVEAGPNAVLAFKREGYGKSDFSPRDFIEILTFPGFWRMASRYWRIGLMEYQRSFSKKSFLKSLQSFVPELRLEDLRSGGSGVRAQALDRQGRLLDDFHVVRRGNIVHVLNVPSPAATASLVIGRQIAQWVNSSREVERAEGSEALQAVNIL